MNNDRRKALGKLKDAIDKARADLETVRDEIDSLKGEEQDYFDNMPESFQQGDKGQAAEAAVDLLENACGNLDDAMSSAEEAMNAIEEAAGG